MEMKLHVLPPLPDNPSGFLLSHGYLMFLGIPIADAAHTPLLVHVLDLLQCYGVRHGYATSMVIQVGDKELLQGCTMVKMDKAISTYIVNIEVLE
jgi:hypothetical protein